MSRLTMSLALIAAALVTVAGPVLAQSESNSGQLSTQYQKVYLNADGTWSPLVQVRGTDGGDASIGAKADAVCATDTGTCSLIALVKRANAERPAPGTAGSPSAEVVSVQGVSGGSPLPIAGGTANTVLSAANPLPVALYIGGGTTPLSVSGTSTDTTSTSGTASRLEVNAVTRIVNAAGTLARQYQIDAVTASGTGVTAVGMAGSSFTNVTSATTTTIKSGAGIWQNMSVNTPAAGTITCYANTAASGTKIGTWTTTTGQPFALTLNYYFTTGLTCVTSAVMDITFGYR